jgi:hypothetical protein
LSHTLFTLVIFQIGPVLHFCPGWPQPAILPLPPA